MSHRKLWYYPKFCRHGVSKETSEAGIVGLGLASDHDNAQSGIAG